MEKAQTIIKGYCLNCNKIEYKEINIILTEAQKQKIRVKWFCSHCNSENSFKPLSFFEFSKEIELESEVNLEDTEILTLEKDLEIERNKLDEISELLQNLTFEIENKKIQIDSFKDEELELQEELNKKSVIKSFLENQIKEINITIDYLSQEYQKNVVLRKNKLETLEKEFLALESLTNINEETEIIIWKESQENKNEILELKTEDFDLSSFDSELKSEEFKPVDVQITEELVENQKKEDLKKVKESFKKENKLKKNKKKKKKVKENNTEKRWRGRPKIAKD